jgi:hypothetical protein
MDGKKEKSNERKRIGTDGGRCWVGRLIIEWGMCERDDCHYLAIFST